MQLKNQNNQSLNSQTNMSTVLNMIKQSGMSPEQIVKNMINSGKINKEQLQMAIDFANSNINK